jgi:zinc transport system substrate-binding protein
MYRKLKRIALFILFLVNFTNTNTCYALNIVSSIKPFYNITAFITQNVDTQQNLLVKSNSSPHDFSLKPSDVTSLNQADLIIWSGPELETFLIKLLSQPQYKTQILQLDSIPNLNILPLRSKHHDDHDRSHDHSHAGNLDPHFWLDPENAKLIATAIAEKLIQIDPKHKQQYKINLTNFNAKLDQLMLSLQSKLESIQHKPYMVFHDGYQYFENYFKLDFAGAVTINTSLPFSAKKIIELQQKMIQQHVVCIFSEPQFQPKIINTLIADTNIKTGELDPLGDDADLGANGYFMLLSKLAGAIILCLT